MSIEMQSKRDIAAKYVSLVAAIMDLWIACGRRMEDWRDPLSAVQNIEAAEAERRARVEALETALRDARCANIVLAFDLSREEGVRGEYMRIVERIDSALKPQPQETGTPKT